MGKATNGDKKGSQWVFWAIQVDLPTRYNPIFIPLSIFSEAHYKWCPFQDPDDAATPEELSGMDVTITALRSSISTLRPAVKLAATKLAALASAPTPSELARLVEKQRTENEEKRERLEGYRNGREKMVTKEEKEKVDAEYKYWAAKRQARKRAFDNLEDLFLAGMTREELWERAGIEGEE